MGVTQEEGAVRILFEYKGEKQYWVGLQSTLENEHKGCQIIATYQI
jgi:hypothetical protein